MDDVGTILGGGGSLMHIYLPEIMGLKSFQNFLCKVFFFFLLQIKNQWYCFLYNRSLSPIAVRPSPVGKRKRKSSKNVTLYDEIMNFCIHCTFVFFCIKLTWCRQTVIMIPNDWRWDVVSMALPMLIFFFYFSGCRYGELFESP